MQAEELRNTLSGKALIVGNSYSLNKIDLSKAKCPTISCNRILRHPTFIPSVLMMSDREAYIQERDEGRLLMYSTLENGKLLLSETIFDPEIKGKRADKDKSREYPAQEKPIFPYYSYKVGAWHTKPNFDTFKDVLCSCANIFGPMLQAAVIMGARDIGVVGVDMQWKSDESSHFFGSGREVGAYPFVSLAQILANFRKLKNELETMGIKVHNLSPEKNTPFARIFNHQEYEEFTQGGSTCG